MRLVLMEQIYRAFMIQQAVLIINESDAIRSFVTIIKYGPHSSADRAFAF